MIIGKLITADITMHLTVKQNPWTRSQMHQDVLVGVSVEWQMEGGRYQTK